MAFKGQRVMLSRTLVPPEMFDMLHGVLKENGAEVCLCSNPELNSSTDFHVLPSWESEKFAELAAQGCKIIGPECILRCAKERRGFPSSPYTCCLTFDGIRILSTGFEGPEKTRVHQLVIAMCGEFCTKASMDVDFVIAKDVLTPKYKWAAFTLRKPILSIQWLWHCFREHRRVPHEPYRLPIFTGIIMCTTGILLEQRNKIAELVKENGGILKADLTRECTHLIAKSAESDKFKVATRHWCHIKCVNEDWFWNSLSEKVCLEESSYAVQGSSTSYGPKVNPVTSGPPPFQDKFSKDALPPAPVPAAEVRSSVSERSSIAEGDTQGRQSGELTTSGEGDQMYLSGCRFFLAGFESVEMRRLVHMVLSGGGTRYMQFNERATHVVLGKPSESELKDIRQYALWDAVHIVMPTWLEECTRQRREVAVSAQFIVPLALLSYDSHWKAGRNKTVPVDEKKSAVESIGARVLPRKLWDASEAQLDTGVDFATSQDKDASQRPLNTLASNPASHPRQGSATELKKRITPLFIFPVGQVIFQEQPNARSYFVLAKYTDAREPVVIPVLVVCDSKSTPSQVPKVQIPGFLDPVAGAGRQPQEPMSHAMTSSAGCEDTRCEPSTTTRSLHLNSEGREGVFQGQVFAFAPSFEASKRAEVVQWVLEGGGVLDAILNAEFVISPHGLTRDPRLNSNIRNVTTQWIKYCLEEGKVLDISSHILFQPLCCEVPLPGFQTLRFAVTQYDTRERILLHNLCHALGAKYQDKKMNRKATHLLCKVGDGEKYEAALQWGVEIVTVEWLYACVAQNKVVAPDPYRPKKLTAAEKEAGLAIPTQYPVQLTSHDIGVPVTERSLAESNAEIPLPAKENEIGRVERKGKTGNIKKKSSVRGRLQVLQGNRPLTDCSLTSQNGGNLDPWDELTASWTNDDASSRPATRSQQKAVSSLRVSSNLPVDSGPSKTHSDLHDEPKEGDRPTDGSQSTEPHRQVQISSELENSADPIGFENEEDEAGRDVAAAIEGLLAQTSKVQSEDASRSPEGDPDLLSHEIIKLGRRNGGDMRERANFKRPKHVTNRSVDSGGEHTVQSAPPAEDSYERFEESQMDSQVVDYDEDHSAKQKIMERVRTRSMPTSSSAGVHLQRKEMPWKAVELKRLLKAADANK